MYCRQFNADFNKLIKTICHVLDFSKNDVKHTHLCQQF